MSCRKECATKLAEYPHRDAREPGVSYEDAVSDGFRGGDRADCAVSITRADSSLRDLLGVRPPDRSGRLPDPGISHDVRCSIIPGVYTETCTQTPPSSFIGASKSAQRELELPTKGHPMTLRTATTTLRNGITTSVAVLGIIVASTIGLHEWADAEAVRSLPAQTADTPTETTTAETGLAAAAPAEASRTEVSPAEATPTDASPTESA